MELITLTYLKSEIDHLLSGKSPTGHTHTGVYQAYNVDTVVDANYVHTDLNFTTALKTQYDTAYSHSQTAHAPANADNTSENETSHLDVLVDGNIGSTVQAYNVNTVIDPTYIHTDNNFTTVEKSKLAGIAESAEANHLDTAVVIKEGVDEANWTDENQEDYLWIVSSDPKLSYGYSEFVKSSPLFVNA